MKKWKIAWLLLMFVVLCAGVIWIFVGDEKTIEISNQVTPTLSVGERKLKVAVMADIHNDNEELKIMLNIAKYNSVEIVVLDGDLTNDGKLSDLVKIKKTLDEVGLRYAVVPGNHEYYLDNFLKVFGKNYQSIRIDETKLILIDNSFWQGLDEEQKKWIEMETRECRVLVCVAIMHKPLNNVLSTHIMGENNKKAASEATWLRELLISSGVKQIESGHLHYASSYELEGIRTDVVGAISRERNNQNPRYTELMIGKNSIERKVIEEGNDTGN